MNNGVFGKTLKNVRKYRFIKLVTTEGRRNYLVLEPNYHATKYFLQIFISHINKRNTNIHQ